MARHLVARGDLYELRNLFRALLARLETARPKDAAAGRVNRARNIAPEHDARAVALLLRIRDWDGRQKRVCVRVQRRRIQHLAWSRFHDLAEVHDRYAMRDLADHREVV